MGDEKTADGLDQTGPFKTPEGGHRHEDRDARPTLGRQRQQDGRPINVICVGKVCPGFGKRFLRLVDAKPLGQRGFVPLGKSDTRFGARETGAPGKQTHYDKAGYSTR